MDPELKKALDQLRDQIAANGNKSVDIAARLDAIEKIAGKDGANVTALRAELDTLKQKDTERANELKEMQQKARLQLLESDPAKSRLQALRIFGMMMRELISQKARAELPAAFRGEAEILKKYREDRALRATVEAGAVTGSYLAPTITSGDIFDAVEEVKSLLGYFDLVTDLPGNVTYPVLASRPTMRFGASRSVDSAMTASDPTFSYVSVAPDEMYCYFPVDQRLMQMSAVALGALCINLCRDSIVDGLCKVALVGDGTSTYNSITGILNESTYVSSMDAGKVSFADVDNDQLEKALAAILKRGRARAKYLMSQYVFGVLQNVNRLGKWPILIPGPNGSILCKGGEIVIDEDMPDGADNAKDTAFMAVGDLKSVLVGIMGGISVATSDQYKFGENLFCFKSVIYADVKRKPVNTLRTLKTAAA